MDSVNNQANNQNELVLLTGQSALDAMAEYRRESMDDDANFRDSVDEMKLVPELSMSKENLDITLQIGDRVTLTQRTFFLTFLNVFGTRGLWPPEQDKEGWGKQPVCSMSFADPGLLKSGADRGVGQWKTNERYAAPYDMGMQLAPGSMVKYECGRCPYNQFESMQAWSGKSTKAKACGEHRTLFVKIMKKLPEQRLPTTSADEELYFFRDNPDLKGFAVFDLSMGTNKKAIESLYLQAAGHEMPMRSCVFKITTTHGEVGGFKFAVMTPEFAGLVHRQTFVDVIKPLGPTVKEFALRNTTYRPYPSEQEVANALG